MRHKYTAQELESITRETPVYLEGAGIAQLQWGGWEIAEGVRDGYLFCKHIKPFAMELHDKYWSHRYTSKHGLQRGSQCAVIEI